MGGNPKRSSDRGKHRYDRMIDLHQQVAERRAVVRLSDLSEEMKPWPLWAKALKQLATPQDKGIGDVVERTIGNENSAKFKAWHLATFGRPCGCNGRQNLWNQKYPLNLKAT